MIVEWRGPLSERVKKIMEEAGYHDFVDPNTKKLSYISRLGTGFYPRFHVYVKKEETEHTQLDIHLDQTKAVREGQTAHAGEYDGPQVEGESQRLLRWLAYYGQR